MFKKRDFNKYFDELYAIEKVMEKDVLVLLDLIENEAARKILLGIVDDERRHAEIVLGLKRLL